MSATVPIQPARPVCPCFPGTCRGGQVVDGKLPNGEHCKACIPVKAPA